MPTFGDYTMRAQPRRRVTDEKEEPVFLRKTFEMICSCDADPGGDLACWSPSGETFIIKDCDAFAQDVIPRFFKHNKFSSFVRQLNFYGFRKVKSSIAADDADIKWWEFKHDLFRRDHPQLLITMKRATHYGAPVDSKEVEDLRSEVNRLRNHIDNMGDKIGQLTSLVEALAVEGAGRPTGSLSSRASADPSRGVRCESGAAMRGWGIEDVDGLGGVGVGLGRLSVDGCGENHDEEDSKLFPPAAPAGAGCCDAAAFLPLHVMSRKRKIMVENVGIGDGPKNVCDNGSVASPWTSGAAASGVVVKQEMIVDPRQRATERPTVKPEMMDEEPVSETPASWPPYAEPPVPSSLTTPDAADAAFSTSDSLRAASSFARGNSGDFLEGFTEQFLSFELPSSSYVFPDRGTVPGAAASAIPPHEAAGGKSTDRCGSGKGPVASVGRGYAMTDIDVDVGIDGSDCRSQSEGEEHIDIEGEVGMLATAMSLGLEGRATAPALAHGVVGGISGTGAGGDGVSTAMRATPSPIQDPSMNETCEKGATWTLPLGLEELQHSLESLPLHSKTKLKEGLSALMQHPTFLAALIAHGQGKGAPVASSASNEETPGVRPTDVADGAISPDRAISNNEGNTSRARSPTQNAEEGCESVSANSGSGKTSSSSSSSNGAGSGGTGSGGCCPSRSQNRGEFGGRLPRSEEACA